MARIIRHTRDTPYKIPPNVHALWVCGCGLSQNKPFCDGSHTQVRREDPAHLYIYNEQTQQVIQSVPDIGALTPLLFSANRKSDTNDVPLGLKKIRAIDQDFQKILDLRLQTNPKVDPEDEFDESADHYFIADQETAIASMRVNQARRGPMDCETFYPKKFLSEYRHLIGSASRLVKSERHRGAPKELFDFVRAVWRDQFLDGMRIDLINVHVPVIPLYIRMGYTVIPHSRFVHPRFKTDSLAMCLIADAKGSSNISSSFGEYYDPTLIETLKRNFPLCDCRVEDYIAGVELCRCPRGITDSEKA